MVPGAVAEGNQRTGGAAAATNEASVRSRTKRRVRKRPQPCQTQVVVPVAFNLRLGCGDAAFVLAEVRVQSVYLGLAGGVGIEMATYSYCSKLTVADVRLQVPPALW